MDGFKPVSIALYPSPLFDARSSSDFQIPGALCWKQNLETAPDGKMRTATGFARPYDQTGVIQSNGVACPYSNADYHDQSVVQADLEIPSLLFPSTANDGTRRLYLGTKSKFLLLDETNGSWSDIGTGFGQDGITNTLSLRWKAAQLQDNIYLTNAFDKVQYTVAGSNSMQEVTGLQTAGESGMSAVAVTKPFVIIQYSGVLLIMNMEEGGVRIPSRIRWSDLNDGTYWGTGTMNPNTGATSISDFQDLTYGQRILAAIEQGGYLYVFTDTSIWRCTFTVDASVNPPQASLLCNEVYSEKKNKSKCIWYPNTLVSDGDSIYYAGHDAIYRYNIYMLDPERTEWIYRASSLIFDDGINGASIDQTSCNSPVMEYWPDRKEIHFSWPVPDAKFVGTPSCDVVPPVVSSGICRYTLVINTEWECCDYRDYGMTCYANFQSNIAAAGQCAQGAMFFGISSADLCMKQMGTGYARVYYNFTTSKYSAQGYTPLFRLVLPLSQFQQDKENKMVFLDAYCPGPDGGSLFALRTGGTYVQTNPNIQIGNCGVIWKKWSSKPVKCLNALTPAQYVAANIRPTNGVQWNFRDRSRFMYLEISVTDAKGAAPVTGGCVFTRIDLMAIDS